ncbi:hypothetical protein D1816_14770 [Aquimarina sp. AD10]|uniref:Uncharacterized protein n=1 Tax=Aquimarina aggregata TaxID=1642818 RepID=A0A162WJZ2_9FLAO|nr:MULTISPECIES: hypothetical protein [Aquimarina]AXT61558.1 hypothetical protein D1816_14770 [Aquimarina sp. AD10]KZS38146.1 hypothetical protein AWE51_19065 [Aquimarina aggregata]RKM90042.1 hypothetical protein D7033_25290 [Aquimarina sp. AD10]
MIDFLKDKACCVDGGSDDPEARECLDKWKEKLEEVSNKYNELSAETSKDEEEYLNSLGWEKRLINWNELIKDTDDKADIIVKELNFFLEQAKIVCDNSEVTTEAIEKLLGLVKSIFDCFFTYKDSNEGLKEQIINFKKAVECLKNASDEDKAEVLACILVYEQKITLVCDMQDAVLKKLLETFKCANLLSSSICAHGGLEDKLEDMLDVFCGTSWGQGGFEGNSSRKIQEEGDDDDDDDKKKKGRKKKPHHDHDHDHHHHYAYPCNDWLVKPMPRFPISESDYYKQLEQNLGVAMDKTDHLEEEWIKSKKKSDKYLSHKTSLIEAITAAEAAESGK